MSSPPSYVTNSVLHIPRRTLLSKYIYLFLTFLLSGLEHAMSDLAQGLKWKQSGSIRFFCTQAVGIFVEDGVQALYCLRVRNVTKISLPRSIAVIVGYVWVFTFMVWSTPVWIYPSLYMNKGEEKDLIVPFSFVGFLSRKLKSF